MTQRRRESAAGNVLDRKDETPTEHNGIMTKRAATIMACC